MGGNQNIHPGARISHGAAEYRIEEELSSGGFGVVYSAMQTKPLQQKLAVKIPAQHVTADPVLSMKFEREAQILANIHHENVVKIVAFWKFSNGEMALVQEFVEDAKGLKDCISSRPESAASVLVQSLYAMRAFHHGAVHRDISPANILVNDRGVVKIIDFGLAKEDPRVTQVLTVTGTWFGTPGCMAPEQMTAAKHVDKRADLYGLGRSMASALSGRNPQFAEPQRLPEPWREICSKLTEHDAENRYQTADEALEVSFRLFADSKTPLTDIAIHVNEMAQRTAPDSWPILCNLHFSNLTDIDQVTIGLAAKLGIEVFKNGIDGNSLFDKTESGSAMKAFDLRNVVSVVAKSDGPRFTVSDGRAGWRRRGLRLADSTAAV